MEEKKEVKLVTSFNRSCEVLNNSLIVKEHLNKVEEILYELRQNEVNAGIDKSNPSYQLITDMYDNLDCIRDKYSDLLRICNFDLLTEKD